MSLQKIKELRATLVIGIVWVALFVVGLFVDLMTPLSGKGISFVGTEIYRFFTGPLLHFGFIHLAVNLSALFWVGSYLEKEMGSVRFATFALVSGTVSEFAYCAIFAESSANIGGSVWIFALFGLIIAYQLSKPDFPRFRLGTWYGNWLVAYAVLGNLPLLPFCTIGTVYTHIVSLVVGFLLAEIGIRCKVL